MIRSACRLALLTALLLVTAAVLPGQNSASSDDPVLRAMLGELQRSKTQLKLADAQPPYYIDYRRLLVGAPRRSRIWYKTDVRSLTRTDFFERQPLTCG